MKDANHKRCNSWVCCCFFCNLCRSVQNINAISEEENQVSGLNQQIAGTLDKNPILKEKDSLDKKQSGEVENIDRISTEIRRLNQQLERAISETSSYIDPCVRHTTVGNLRQTERKKGASPNNKEQQSLPTSYSNVVRDMIGARSSPVELVRPALSFTSSNSETTTPASPPQPLPSQGNAHAKPPRPSDGLRMSYTEIFHTLVGQGLITPLPADTAESFLQSDLAFLQSCEYHSGQRGHSTENCIQLRCQVQKLMKDGLFKIEPPKLVVADKNNSSVPNSENISNDPGSMQAFNGKEIGHSIVKEEYDRILQEMNSSNDQLFRQQKKEMQISKKRKHKGDQTAPKEEYDRVFQEMNSMKNQLSLLSGEVNLLKHTSEQTKGNNLSQKLDKKQALFSLNSVSLALFIFCCFMVTWYMCW